MAIVGARRRRQGTGEYIAREFARCGCDIRAIVGTTEQSIELARAALRQRYGIHCRGFTSLAALLDAASIDIVAICSPSYAHRAQLDVAAEAGCHVFCEKPLWWDDALTSHTAAADDVRRHAERLLRRFVQQHRYLGLN
ncbi:MAG: Gfo/Idh/MocA family oxidoreductase, partial [Acidiferrobacterales bacterium]